MPPKGSKIARFEPDAAIEHTPEYDEFIKKLTEYHEKRGTIFEAEPKVGMRYINLLDLYNRIVEDGGYDSVSDTKGRPLMWRKIAEEFIGKGPHIAAQAFQVKSVYYKNLAAYEISEHWKEEPPPKEILEDLTAKGGGIRGRKLEDFERPGNRETDKLANGDDSGSEDQDKAGKDKDDAEDTALTGRSSRGLRQAPPQRVLFQPDLNPARQSRASAQQPSPSPSLNTLNNLSHPMMTSTNTTLANYEPRQQYPLTLKPVTTPANNPDYYRLKRKQIEEANAPSFAKRFKGIMLPGTGFIGPNIYVRAQLALQSGLPDEERYALHHLVKISHERGDKYRFDQFPGLAEALVNKLLQVSGLFYDVEWNVDLTENDTAPPDDSLDGLNGTPSIMRKLRSHVAFDLNDSVQSRDYYEQLGRITEAGLVLRNMVMLEENAQYVARLPLVRDYATILLSLNHPSLVELQHFALETVEQLSVFYNIDCNDQFYKALLAQIGSSDRGKIVTALRTTARLGMRFRENKRLEEIPEDILQKLCDWLLIEDEELRSASLDLMYQYTSTSTNVEHLIRAVNVAMLVKQLSKLLLSDARKVPYQSRRQVVEDDEEEEQITKVPRLAKGLIEKLLEYDEPSRSSHWLRMCFQDDPNAEMTQIDLWKSYQGTFLPYITTHPHLIAGDFIKNVSNTFTGASAQVAGQNKYVIRGIKPRKPPVDYRGRELLRCQWHAPRTESSEQVHAIFADADGPACGQWFPNSSSVLEHILLDHLQIPRKKVPSPADGETEKQATPQRATIALFDYAAASSEKPQRCAWSVCQHTNGASDVPKALGWRFLARHIDTHLSDVKDDAHKPAQKPSEKKQKTESSHYWLNTAVDETLKDACGLPVGAVLCLRNIARALGKLPLEGELVDEILGIVGETSGFAEPDETDEIEKQERRESVKISDEVASQEQEDEVMAAAPKVKDDTPRAILMSTIFGSVKSSLFFTLSHNHVLRDYVGEVLRILARNGAC